MPIRVSRMVVALVCVGIAVWFSPWVTAAAWHAFHPRGWVNYRGLHVRVPWPWIKNFDADKGDVDGEVSVSPQGISLKKMPQTVKGRASAQWIFVTVISPDPRHSAEEQTAEWLRMFREAHAGAEFSTAAADKAPAGASCQLARRRRMLVWTCISVSGGWVANFEGDEAEAGAGAFFEVVSNLRR